MGLLDNIDEPTMAMAMGLLGSGGYSRMPVSTGQGMAAGFGAYQEAKRAQQQKAMQDLHAQHLKMQMEQEAQMNPLALKQAQMQMSAQERALKTKELLGKALQSGAMQTPQLSDVAPYSGGYSPAVSSAFGVPAGIPQVQHRQAMTQGQQGYADKLMAAAMQAGDVDAYNEAAKLKLEEKKLAPKFAADVRVVSINGKPTPVQMADDGSWRPMGDGVSPADKLHFADNGQLAGIGLDPYSGKVMSPGVQKQQDPNSIASNAVTIRGQNMTDARSRDLLEQGGKPPSGYRFTPNGNMEAIPGGPADLKAQALAGNKAAGAADVGQAVAILRDAYDRLEKGGGITNAKNNTLDNVGAALSSSGIGQTFGKMVGSENQSARNDIAMTRPALLAALMKATGMSAKQMDSNAELKLWMATATDPTLDVGANRRALDNIERKYLGASSADLSAPTGIDLQSAAQAELARRRGGR